MTKPPASERPQRFQPGKSGNPRGRPKGIPDRRNAWRDRLAEHLPELIDDLVKRAKAGDEFSIKLILERVAPPLRPQGQVVEVQGLEDAHGLAAKAELILRAVGLGQMPVETGRLFLEALGSVARIAEFDELTKRVEELERKQESSP